MATTFQQSFKSKYVVPPFFNPRTVFVICCLFFGYAWVYVSWMDDKAGIPNLYLLMLIQLTPFLLAISRLHYNFLAFVLFNHFATYSLAKLNEVTNLHKAAGLPTEALTAIQETTICTLLIIAMYMLARQLFFFRFVHKERFQMLNLSRTQLLFVAGYVISVPLFVNNLPSYLVALHFAAMAADMVLLLCSTSEGNERLASYLRGGVFLSSFWYFLATGFLSLVGNLATYLFIVGCLRRNVRMLMLPVVLAVLGSAIQTVKFPYRMALNEDPDKPAIDRVFFLADLITTHYFTDIDVARAAIDELDGEGKPVDTEEVRESLLHGFNRVGDDSLERVLALTPSRVPYWDGETYSAIPFMFIPRILWPNKPTRHIWNKFGKAYGYLSEDDNQTSVGVGFLAEGYMNFGYVGLYGVAIFMGFLIALVERVSYYFLGGYFFFTFVCFLMPLMQSSSDLSSIIMSCVIISSVLFVFRTQFIKMARKDDYS